MAAHVLRLRLALLAGAFRAEPRVAVRRAIGVLLLIAVMTAAGIGLLRLDVAQPDVGATVTVLGGAALTLGFLLLPLLAAADDPLDPRRFAVLGASPSRLPWLLLAAAPVSVPSLLLLGTTVCLAVVWAAHGASVGVVVAAAALAFSTTLLAGRVSLALGALALRDRRSPELTGVLLGLAVVVLLPASVLLATLEWSGGLPQPLTDAARLISATPIGAAWALPWADGAEVVPTVLVALVTLLFLGAAWVLLTRRLLTTTERPLPVRERRGLGWFAVLPGRPGGAIAARSLVYWFADPRHIANVVVVPVLSVVAIVPLLIVDVPVETVALVPAPLMALFFGWLVHNDVAYDSSGIWMHLAAAVRGVADRLGRLVPVVLIAVPLLAIAIAVSVLVHGDPAALAPMIGVCASLFLCGLGLSSVSSALAPYAVTRPGDGMFQQPQRTGGAGAQALVLLGALALSAPAGWWAWRALAGEPGQADLALWGGLGIGAAVLVLGVLAGGLVFRRRTSRIMEFAETT